jgi:ribosome biogenesis GTPase
VDEGSIKAFKRSCGFPGLSLSNCSHTQEPDCAVLAAVTKGELSDERYSSFMKLKKESEYHELSYLDKRKKERAFGRFIKSAKKQMKV